MKYDAHPMVVRCAERQQRWEGGCLPSLALCACGGECPSNRRQCAICAVRAEAETSQIARP